MKKIYTALFFVLFLTTLNVKAELPPFDFNFEIVYENEYAKLLLDRSINNFRVELKSNGAFFDTIVPNGQAGSLITRNIQRADFNVNIIRDEFSGATFSMDSFTQSVDRRQVEYTNIPNGMRANFTLGDPDAIELDMFPFQISAERLYEHVLQFMTTAEQTRFFGTLYSTELEGRHVRMFVPGQSTPIPLLRQMLDAFYTKGTYTLEELEYDNAVWGEPDFIPTPLVYIAVEYTLDGPDLIVTIPRSGMQFGENNPFTSIDVNPYFLSGSEFDAGYIFIPDGSGGIINFNNGITEEVISIPLFGPDPLFNAWTYREPFLRATLPVYGIVRNDTAILAIIEEGAASATINANVSGRLDEFNRVNASFELLYMESPLTRGSGISRGANIILEVYNTDIRQRYVFLTDEEANYVGMARAYQNYLLNNNLLKSNPLPDYAPFFIEMIASTPQQRMFLGIPYTHHFATTSASHAISILESLTNQGINNIHAKYSHWGNDGMMASNLNRLRPLRSIGGRRGMQDLQQASERLGVNLYPMARASTFYFNSSPSRFSGIRNTMLTRGINNITHAGFFHRIPDRGLAGSFLMLSPNFWADYANTISVNFANFGFNNMAVPDIGGMLFGNYGRRYTINRLEAVDHAIEAFQALNQDANLMLLNPNVYGLGFASAITGLPYTSGGRRMVDYNIPFTQMVLENHVPFAMPAYNANDITWRNFDEYFLRAIESRSALNLILTHENERAFLSAFSSYGVINQLFFQTEFNGWEHIIGEYYARYNEFFQEIRGAYITSHTIIGQNVIVEYDNGVRIYINYGNSPWEINGHVVRALDFEVIR